MDHLNASAFSLYSEASTAKAAAELKLVDQSIAHAKDLIINACSAFEQLSNTSKQRLEEIEKESAAKKS